MPLLDIVNFVILIFVLKKLNTITAELRQLREMMEKEDKPNGEI